MVTEKNFLVDVGISELALPMRVISKTKAEGQHTIANISINARIMQEFEARWIDKFIQIVHSHRDKIGTETLKVNILDYLNELNASSVAINFDYPYFIEKIAPKSGEKSLVKYLCTYSSKSSTTAEPKIMFKMQIPCITTYPGSAPEKVGGLFGQLSVVHMEIESKKDFYAEDLVDLVDRKALSPVYSFLTENDQHAIIQKIHSKEISSVTMIKEIQSELASNKEIDTYLVRCFNYGMLHGFNTIISTEKSRWVPFSGYSVGEEEDI